MRSAAALLAVLLGASTTARADELAHTRDVLAKHATSARRTRIIAGATLTVAGVAFGVAGYATVDQAGDGLLSGVAKAYGYSMLGVGGLLAIAGPLLAFKRSELETMRDEVTDEHDAQLARTQIAANAKRAHGTRVIVRGMGATLAGLGTVATLTAVVGGDSIDRGAHNELMGAGIALGIWGVGMIAGSFVSSRWEDAHDDLQSAASVPLTAGLVPVRGGAVLGIAGQL